MPESAQVPHVLVIDDCEIARAEMSHRLSTAGFRVSNLASPIGATRAIVDQSIDVVISEVQMPSIRGDRLAALFRGNPRFSNLGVILVTGGNEAELAQLREVAQADAVLSKGSLERLVTLVRETFKKHR
jgi:CheY-like chemotaxis protein